MAKTAREAGDRPRTWCTNVNGFLFDELQESYEQNWLQELADAGVPEDLLHPSASTLSPVHKDFTLETNRSGILASCVYYASLLSQGRDQSFKPATLQTRRNLQKVVNLRNLMTELLRNLAPDPKPAIVLCDSRFKSIIAWRLMLAYEPHGWEIPKSVKRLMGAESPTELPINWKSEW